MYVLNLDKDFNPIVLDYLNYDLGKFSGGEINIKIHMPFDSVDSVIITHRINNSDNLMEVLMAKDSLEREGVKNIELFIPYLPYARQDRICDFGEAFSLKVFANIINSCQFDKVTIFDAHSDVAPALINNCVNVSNLAFVYRTYRKLPNTALLISPDAGAHKKSYKISTEIGVDMVKCDKVRNPSNGKLSGFQVFADDLNGQNCLIVDDICDGGGTFIGLAKELKKKNCGKIYLFVTHGIFSKGLDVFDGVIDHIYTTDSIKNLDHKLLTQLKIKL